MIAGLREELESQGNEAKNSKLEIVSHVEAELDYLRREFVCLNKDVENKN